MLYLYIKAGAWILDCCRNFRLQLKTDLYNAGKGKVIVKSRNSGVTIVETQGSSPLVINIVQRHLI